LRLVIALLPGLAIGLALAGCDRQKAAEPQAQAAANTAVADGAAANGAAGSQAYPTGELDRSHAGTPAPDIAFEDPQGRPTSFAAFRGRPLLVNLWATWCGPCIVEMPSLDALAEREGDRLQVLALSQDMEGRDRVTEFFGARRFNRLEPYLDPRLDVMARLRIEVLPTTILYDAQGREVWRMTGMAEWDGERAARLLTEAGVAP
jgi:thiol-disulfide isomerase/thioredoxin